MTTKGEPLLRVPAKLSEAAAGARAACVIVDTASSGITTRTALDRADMAAELAMEQLRRWRAELRAMRENHAGVMMTATEILARQGWHRHAIECAPSLAEGVNRIIRDEPARFRFCDICGEVPTKFLARTP